MMSSNTKKGQKKGNNNKRGLVKALEAYVQRFYNAYKLTIVLGLAFLRFYTIKSLSTSSLSSTPPPRNPLATNTLTLSLSLSLSLSHSLELDL
jgi:hypothetical protein